ncbi:ankyrin repeat domain-containing protein [Streptosporangium saharense]|uniref:ankyrin repeat domain-containing protein n=1 Tax=Streptosporangium saharense TaxID=1706840 RepID=UPI00342509A1
MAVDRSESSGTDWDGRTVSVPDRARPDANADPTLDEYVDEAMLHDAAENDSPEEVAELARLVADADTIGDDDAEYPGRTALWTAVFANRPDNARVLVSAGADPWLPMMNSWSPGRLSLAGPTPKLFTVPPGQPGLSAGETAAVTEARRLITALGDFHYDGLSMACVADITAAEATARLEATPDDGIDVERLYEGWWNVPDAELIVGITDVPGGCVITQPWGYTPSTLGVVRRVSSGTVCYSMYSNPKGGNSGRIARDDVVGFWEPPTVHSISFDDPAEEILAAYLYRGRPLAFCCAGAGLRLADARPITGPSDIWQRLPERDYWI